MAIMNVSLPDEMRTFVEAQATKEGFGTTSEYLRSMIRDVQQRWPSRRWRPSFWKGSKGRPF